MDEIDAIGSKRYDSSSGGTKEIQRTMIELLTQLDGFDERSELPRATYTHLCHVLRRSLRRCVLRSLRQLCESI